MSGRAPDEPRLAFEDLFRDTRTDLLAYIARRSRSPEDAADVLAETYLIAWRRFDAIPKGEDARLWLFGVARNLLLKRVTGLGARRVLVERLAAELRRAQPAYPSGDDDRSAQLRAALAAIPERDREIVMLTAWEDLTPKQIAAVLSLPVNVVRVRLHRARRRLKRELSTRPLSATSSPLDHPLG